MYAPFDQVWLYANHGHIVSVPDLAPDAIKKALDESIRHASESPKRTTLLNLIANRLGAKGGWAGYTRDLYPKILSFLKSNGMHQRGDLVSTDFGLAGFSRRQIADRIFYGPPVERIFTGYNATETEVFGRHSNQCPSLLANLEAFDAWDKVNKWSKEAGEAPEPEWDPSWYAHVFAYAHNLRGDAFVTPCESIEQHPVPFYKYGHGRDLDDPITVRIHVLLPSFHNYICSLQHGWVEVVRFSDDLVFLRGEGGAYDFVFRDLRSERPEQITDRADFGVIGYDDLPSFVKQHEPFDWWLTKQSGIWLEKLQDEAEDWFWQRHSNKADYPDPGKGLVVIRMYLEAKGRYSFSSNRPCTALEGFRRVERPDRRPIYIQERPVTIGEFRTFMQQSRWANRRYEISADSTERGLVDTMLDPWEIGNAGEDDQPAALTWYDVIAYCNWYEIQNNRAVRPASREEYHCLLGRLKVEVPIEPCLEWEIDNPVNYTMSGSPEPGLVPLRRLKELTGMTAYGENADGVHPRARRYNENCKPSPVRYKPIRWITSADGLRFINAPDFWEWTKRFAVIPISGEPREAEACVESWGARHSAKIGLRLCFDAE